MSTNPQRIRMMDFMVHFREDNILKNIIYFDVYPVLDWSGSDDTTGTSYIDLENEPDLRLIFEENKCLQKLAGSYCWRGVWEGRLYFKDTEYWSEELEELSTLFKEHIEPWCKEHLRKLNPNATDE